MHQGGWEDTQHGPAQLAAKLLPTRVAPGWERAPRAFFLRVGQFFRPPADGLFDMVRLPAWATPHLRCPSHLPSVSPPLLQHARRPITAAASSMRQGRAWRRRPACNKAEDDRPAQASTSLQQLCPYRLRACRLGPCKPPFHAPAIWVSRALATALCGENPNAAVEVPSSNGGRGVLQPNLGPRSAPAQTPQPHNAACWRCPPSGATCAAAPTAACPPPPPRCASRTGRWPRPRGAATA
eukprot:353989-Chlamydomonas_euryale.AAC.1